MGSRIPSQNSDVGLLLFKISPAVFVTFQNPMSGFLKVSNSYKDSRLLIQSKLAVATKNH